MSKRITLKFIALPILIIFILFVTYFFSQKAIFKYYILPQNQIERYEKSRDSILKRSSGLNRYDSVLIDTNSIVFVGNSLTVLFDTDKYFSKANCVNCGTYGDVTFGLLLKIVKIAQNRPKKIFIEIGINDILFGFPMDSVVSNYLKILDSIHKLSPKSKVYCQGILPVGSNDTEVAKNINQIIIDLNSSISQISKGKSAEYIDLNRFFSKNGSLADEYDSGDKLHLNSNAYQKWSGLIKPYVYK